MLLSRLSFYTRYWTSCLYKVAEQNLEYINDTFTDHEVLNIELCYSLQSESVSAIYIINLIVGKLSTIQLS